MSTGTCGRIQKRCKPEIIFQKKNSKYEILTLNDMLNKKLYTKNGTTAPLLNFKCKCCF